MDTDRLLQQLTDFLRIPSISTLPAHSADCRAAAEWVAAELRRLGCREVQFLASGTHPVVWGIGPEVPGAPTLLLYGHYDVQPPDPLDEWTTPPFQPSVRDGRLFARGAADDKGQVFCLLKAIEAAGRPPVNFRFLIEGEEEYGSRVLFDLLRREPERTKAELTTWRRLPFSETHFLKQRVQAKALVGLKQYSVLERLWALPTFEIHGVLGGFTGEGAKTVIPAEATAKVSLRLVPKQKLKTVERQLAAAVKRLVPRHVQASVRFLHGADPAVVPVDHPAFRLLDRAFREVVGRGTVAVRAGGSIPVVPALGKSGAPVVLTGIGLPDDRLHAPNEKLDLKQLWDGIAVFKRFYELLGQKRTASS